jgi:GH24 family phage-related lysozyme (muramidase)|tara:strand:- start:1761 stop:2249 length:489 start_codon:yes stop_codon:yes gene_type:complete
MADNKTASQYAAQRSNEFYKKIIRKDEDFRGEAYKLPNEKHFTIGYGFYDPSIKETDTITKPQAEKRLDLEVKQRLKSINKLIDNFDQYPAYLRGPVFSEHYRGSIQQSPQTRKLMNEGKFSEAADEFLDNDQYRNADKLKIPGIKARMERVSDALKKYGKQ